MARWEINDFNNPSTEVLFDLCMENYGSLALLKDLQSNINREDFRDFLVKYDLQSYTDLLINYQMGWRYMNEILKERREKRDNIDKKILPHSVKVARILKMFLLKEIRNTNDLKVTVSDLYKIDIDDPELLNQFKDIFFKEFERLGLNETELTTEEVKEEVEDIVEGAWFEEYGCTAEEILSDPYYLEKYRQDHYRRREVTLELVNNTVSELELRQNRLKGRFGAKIKNLAIGELAKRLSYLQRIHQFFNQNEYASIKEYPLTNKSCRFGYEYLEFWKLLSNDVILNTTTKEQRTNYAKSLIRNNEELLDKMMYNELRYFLEIIEWNLELRIDSFKNVKDGLLTPEEYYERMSFRQH